MFSPLAGDLVILLAAQTARTILMIFSGVGVPVVAYLVVWVTTPGKLRCACNRPPFFPMGFNITGTLEPNLPKIGSYDFDLFFWRWGPRGDLPWGGGHHPRKTPMHVQSAREISRVKSMGIFRKFKQVKIAQNWPLTFGLHSLGG